MTKEEAQKIVESAVKQLIEHFDAVQILTTWHDSDCTQCCNRGAGNWWARTGLAQEFLNCDYCDEMANSIASKIHPDPMA